MVIHLHLSNQIFKNQEDLEFYWGCENNTDATIKDPTRWSPHQVLHCPWAETDRQTDSAQSRLKNGLEPNILVSTVALPLVVVRLGQLNVTFLITPDNNSMALMWVV